MMMPSLNLFSPPKVTIKRRRYVLDDDDHDDKKTSATATTGTVTCDYHDVHDTDHYLHARPTKRHRRCITPVPSFTNLSLFLPILEDPKTAIQEGGSPPPSLPLSYRQEEEDDERRGGAGGGRSVSPSNYLFDETTPFLQPKKKKISLLQDIKQEEAEQPYDIEQEEQQGSSRCCYLNPVVYNNNSNNSNPSPLPRMKINKSTRNNSSSRSYSSSSQYLKSHTRGYQEDTDQRQRHTPRRVVPTPSPFLSYSSSPVTTHTNDDTIAIVEHFQRAIRLSSEEQDPEEELPSSLPTTPHTSTIKTPPLFDMLRY